MQHHFKTAAIAAAVLSTFHVFAASETVGPEVVVTATRFSERTLKSASNITVISDQDIRNSPATNLPDVLKTAAGVDVRPLYGSLGIDATVDLRGFGDTAQSNTLILLDGQRLNPIDSGSLSWSAIPINSIRRIEIIRGSGTVLYGDQASGGVINIITDKSGSSGTSLMASAGSYGYRGVDANTAAGSERGYVNIAAHYADADGWRDNSKMNQKALSGRGGLYLPYGEAFADYAIYTDKSGLPGSLLSTAYRSDPKSARNPNDSQNRDGYRFRPGFSYALSDAIRIESELSASHEKYHGDNVSFASTFDRARDTWALTPRLRWQHGLGDLTSETVIGMDYYDGDVKAEINGAAFFNTEKQGATQKSTSFYAQNSTDLTGGWLISTGLRSERMKQSASQGAYVADFGFGPFPSPAFNGDSSRTRDAYDLGLVYQSTGWRIYGKAGTTFRFANTDELFAFDPFTGNPVFAGDLKPQHGTIGEVGARFEQGPVKSKLSLYRLDLTDEIGFDGALFANVNLPSTRRNGLEAEVQWAISPSLLSQFSYTFINAKFRGGANSGKELPLVARNKATAQLSWNVGDAGRYTAIANYVGDRRYSGDFANIRGNLSGYATMDLQASWDLKPWTITAKLLNAFDQRYAAFAGYSTFRSDYFYFPADARSLFLSSRYQFN